MMRIALVGLVLGLLLLPATTFSGSSGERPRGADGGSGGPLPGPTGTGRASAVVAPAALPPGFDHSFVGPVGGHYYDVSTRADAGLGQDPLLAVDNQTHEVYALNRGEYVLTVYGEQNATLLQFLDLPVTAVSRTLDLDPAHHLVWVSFQPFDLGAGWTPSYLWGLDEGSLAVVVNITLYGNESFPFDPSTSLFVPATGQIFLQNATGAVGIFNTSTRTLSPVIPGPGPGSSGAGLAYFENSTSAFAVSADYPDIWYAIDGRTDTILGSWAAPSGTTLEHPVADGPDGTIWFQNNSHGYAVFDANGTYRESIASPVYLDGLTYIGELHAFAVCLYPPNRSVLLFNASTQAPLGSAAIPALFYSTAYDAASSTLLTGGVDNGSLLAIRLSPTVAVTHEYPSLPAGRPAMAVDPDRGRFFVLEDGPFDLQAYNTSTGALAWSRNAPELTGAGVYTMAVDTGDGDLFLGLSTSNATLLQVSGADGSIARNLTLATGIYLQQVWVDGTNRLLYALYYRSPNYGLLVFNTSSETVVDNTTLPSWFSPCVGAVNPTGHSLYLMDCQYPSMNVSEFSGENFSLFATHPLPRYNSPNYYQSIPVNATGVAFIPMTGGGPGHPPHSNVSVIDPGHPSADREFALPDGYLVNGAASDDPDGLLYVDTSPIDGYDPIQVYSEATFARLGQLPEPVESSLLGFDGPTRTLIAPMAWGGQITTFRQVPVPAVPGNVEVAPGNGTLSVAWAPVPALGGYAIDGYNVTLSTSADGPWNRSLSTSATNGTIAGLTDGRLYFVRVQAFGIGGTGPGSLPQGATPIGVPYPPVGVVLSVSGTDRIGVHWQAPGQDGGGPITNYSVEYQSSGPGWSTVSVGTATSTTLRGLAAGTTYTIRVVAWNAAGAGSPSAAHSATTGAGTTNWWDPTRSPVDGVVAAVLLAAGVGGYLLLRRRHRPPVPPPGAVMGPPSADASPGPGPPPSPP